MRDTYFFTPKKTVELLGLTEIAAQRRSNSDHSITVLTRADLALIQPEVTEVTIDESGNEVLPEGYVRFDDLIIHNTITPLGHAEALVKLSKGKFVISK